MIHLVCDENLHRYGPQLDQMFALRRREAIPRSGAAGGAADTEDDELAIYLMEVDEQGVVFAAVRLHPGPDEASRWRADRWLALEGSYADGDLSLARLVIGLLEFSASHELTSIEVRGDAALQRRLTRLGCRLDQTVDLRLEMHTDETAREAFRSRDGTAAAVPTANSAGRFAARG